MVSRTFSLLWFSEEREAFVLDDLALDHLNIDEILKYSCKNKKAIRKYLCQVPINIDDIQYRQGLLEELADNRPLLDAIRICSEKCFNINKRVNFNTIKEANVYNLMYLVDNVNQVMENVEELYHLMRHIKMKSEGMIKYKQIIEEGLNHPLYKGFNDDIKKVKPYIMQLSGLKVGINLDEYLRPYTGILLSFHDKAFKLKNPKKPSYKFQFNPNKDARLYGRTIAEETNVHTIYNSNPLGNIEEILRPALKQLISFCQYFIESILAIHSDLYEELEFYKFGIDIYDSLRYGGFYVCQPLIFNEGKTIIDSLYNANLAYKMLSDASNIVDDMVYNRHEEDQQGNIFVLTGANRGGKTTFTQAIGQVILFAQLGFYVPAKKAAIKIVDGIYFHFPNHEEPDNSCGKFGNECSDFARIFNQLTSNSLLLMNESFSGTSHLESLTIAFEVVKALQELGITTLFNTHLHELGRMIEELNGSDYKKIRCISLVTGTDIDQNLYTITEGEPLGQSYAQDIAIRFGLTFEQLIRDDRLRKIAMGVTS